MTEETERTKEIDDLKEYMETDEYAEEVARDKLGLVKDNEIVFKEQE
jgi:cell division protein DivIC